MSEIKLPANWPAELKIRPAEPKGEDEVGFEVLHQGEVVADVWRHSAYGWAFDGEFVGSYGMGYSAEPTLTGLLHYLAQKWLRGRP